VAARGGHGALGALQRGAAFAELSAEELRALAAIARRQVYARGALLREEAVVLVGRGSLQIYRPSPAGCAITVSSHLLRYLRRAGEST
jgi:hypothetical protein